MEESEWKKSTKCDRYYTIAMKRVEFKRKRKKQQQHAKGDDEFSDGFKVKVTFMLCSKDIFRVLSDRF